VHSHIEKLLKQEEYRKIIELGKLDNKDIDIESGNNTSEKDGGDNFRHLKNNTFLESDKSGFESENYTDNETNNKKDSDNKN